METRSELETTLETLLLDIIDEVNSRGGRKFDGDLEDALEYLSQAKLILNQLNKDKYEDATDSEESDLKEGSVWDDFGDEEY